jgi:hypothetical protein
MRLAADDKNGALDAAKRGQAADASAQGPAVLALELMELMEPKLPEAEALVKNYLDDREGTAQPEIRMA